MTGEELRCDDLVEMVTDYLDGTLDEETRAVVDEHLALCDGCARYLEQIRLTIAHVGAIQDDALTPRAWDELRAAFRALG